jgi:hypothetical protein
LQLKEIVVRPVTHQEQSNFHKLMQRHHYLGSARPIGEILHYVAAWRTQWIALLGFSSAFLKYALRDATFNLQVLTTRYGNQCVIKQASFSSVMAYSDYFPVSNFELIRAINTESECSFYEIIYSFT